MTLINPPEIVVRFLLPSLRMKIQLIDETIRGGRIQQNVPAKGFWKHSESGVPVAPTPIRWGRPIEWKEPPAINIRYGVVYSCVELVALALSVSLTRPFAD